MSEPVKKQNRVAKRGCLWLLFGLPSLLLIYLFLLSTSIFDIKPSRYPDLEIQARGKTKPFLEALAAAPEWAAWKASEIARNDALNELRQDSPTRPKSESAAALRPELARAISLKRTTPGNSAKPCVCWRLAVHPVNFRPPMFGKRNSHSVTGLSPT
jgi:hypothetical protein